jgi:hypothetical protein
MTKIRHSVLAVALCSLVLTSPLQAKKAEPQTYQTSAISVPQVFNGDASIKLSMEQIMADPDWLGRQPEQALWSADSQQVFYQRKQQGNELRDWFVRPLAVQGNGEQVALASQHQIGVYF